MQALLNARVGTDDEGTSGRPVAKVNVRPKTPTSRAYTYKGKLYVWTGSRMTWEGKDTLLFLEAEVIDVTETATPYSPPDREDGMVATAVLNYATPGIERVEIRDAPTT